jgi:hypothetical protein
MAWLENNRNNSKWNQKNTQFNYLHEKKASSEVISPISLGMEPFRALPPNEFGSKI